MLLGTGNTSVHFFIYGIILSGNTEQTMYANYHAHTYFSDDCSMPMETCVKQAVKEGLDEICFTEHIDIGVYSMHDCDCKAYLKEFNRMQKLYGNRINLKFGMEFGMQSHTIPQYEKIFHSYDFDFILLSLHQINNREFWSQSFQSGKTQKQYIEEYYDELYRIVSNYNNYSVLGHMDVIRRYDRMGAYPFEKIKDKVETILRKVIENGKGIEVNTSCYRYNIGDLTPSINIIKLYKELGGEIITIGADSHYPEHVVYKIKDTEKILKDLGFKYICTFDKMLPAFHPIMTEPAVKQ